MAESYSHCAAFLRFFGVTWENSNRVELRSGSCATKTWKARCCLVFLTGIIFKKLHLLGVGAQRWLSFFLSRPKPGFGAAAEREPDFRGWNRFFGGGAEEKPRRPLCPPRRKKALRGGWRQYARSDGMRPAEMGRDAGRRERFAREPHAICARLPHFKRHRQRHALCRKGGRKAEKPAQPFLFHSFENGLFSWCGASGCEPLQARVANADSQNQVTEGFCTLLR